MKTTVADTNLYVTYHHFSNFYQVKTKSHSSFIASTPINLMSPYLSALTQVNTSNLNCLLLAEQYLNARWQWEINGSQKNPSQIKLQRLLPSSLTGCWSLDWRWRDQWVCWQVATASAFMEKLRGRRGVKWVRQTWGVLCRTFTGWWGQTSIFLNASKKKNAPIGVTHQSAAFILHILLPDGFVARRKREEDIDSWRISMWREIQLYLCIFLNIVLFCLSLLEWKKKPKFSKVRWDSIFSLMFRQAHFYTALTSFLK